MVVTMAAIRNGVRRLGLAGRPLCVHASLRSFGRVAGGPETVVDALLGEGCTVLVPTFSFEAYQLPPPDDPRLRPARNGWDYRLVESGGSASAGRDRPYTPETAEIDRGDMGAIPAAVVARPGRARGDHPLCSFAALGPLAAPLTAGQSPANVYAPLRALAGAGGWVLLMGVGLDKLTLLHSAEQQAGRRLFLRWALGADGRPMGVETGGCSKAFPRLKSLLAPLGRETLVGGSRWRAFPAQEAIAAAARAIRDDPMVTHCGRADCLRCNDAVAGGPLFQVTGTSASAGPPGTVSEPEAGPDRPERLARRDEAGHRGSGPSGTGGPTTVPVLLITGPVGVGKTTTAMRAGDLLAGANRPHAVVDFDGLASCYPPPADDPYNSRLAFRNLAAVWANYAAAGAERLIIARVIEARHELEHYRLAVPGADITVVRLRASDETLRERVLGRRVTTGPRAVRRALELARLMDERRLEHHLVETSGRSVAEVAKEVLRQARWL